MHVREHNNKQLCKFMMLKVVTWYIIIDMRIIHTQKVLLVPNYQKVLLVPNYRKMTNNAECNKYL